MSNPSPSGSTAPRIGKLTSLVIGLLALGAVGYVTSHVLEATHPRDPDDSSVRAQRLAALRTAESEALNTYQLVNPKTGDERIPIQAAMTYTAAKAESSAAQIPPPIPPEPFTSNPKVLSDLKDTPKIRSVLEKSIAELFGTSPLALKVPTMEGGFDSRRLHEGAVLYTRYCANCHGTTGNGAGPTGVYYNPSPRNFQTGKFKFVSTSSGGKPTRNDLHRTIYNGLAKAMPAFGAVMTAEQIDKVIDYTKFLSVRGETELALLNDAGLLDESTVDTSKPADAFEAKPADVAKKIQDRWTAVDGLVFKPTSPPRAATLASIARGKALYLDAKVGCTGCHGPHGLGNGPSFIEKSIYDRVTTEKKTPEQAIREEYAALKKGPTPPKEDEAAYVQAKLTLWGQSVDDWGGPLRPANLTQGEYKGGSEPIELYYRLAGGINGAKMPSHYPSLLQEGQLWDVVNFIRALPYQPTLLADTATTPLKSGAQASRPINFGVYIAVGVLLAIVFFAWALAQFPGLRAASSTIFDANEPVGRPTESYAA